MGDVWIKYLDFFAVSIPQQGADLFGMVGAAIYHCEQDTINFEFSIDLPPYLVDGLQ